MILVGRASVPWGGRPRPPTSRAARDGRSTIINCLERRFHFFIAAYVVAKRTLPNICVFAPLREVYLFSENRKPYLKGIPERHPHRQQPVVVHPFPEIKDVGIKEKVVGRFPFQGGQAVERGTPIAVLGHGLGRALEDQGGQAEELAVEVQPQAQGQVMAWAEVSLLPLPVGRQLDVGVEFQLHAGLVQGLPVKSLVGGKTAVLVGKEGPGQMALPIQPRPELMFVG